MNETMAPSAPAVPDKAALRSDLQQSQAAFHALLDSLTPDDWKKKSANPAWTIRQVLFHIASSTAFARGRIEPTRNGKGPNPPQFMVDPIKLLLIRMGARRATKESLEKTFDESVAATIAAIDGLRDDEWAKTARAYGETHSVEDIIRLTPRHFAEHVAEINGGLGRS